MTECAKKNTSDPLGQPSPMKIKREYFAQKKRKVSAFVWSESISSIWQWKCWRRSGGAHSPLTAWIMNQASSTDEHQNTHTFYFHSCCSSRNRKKNRRKSIRTEQMLSICFYFCVYRNQCTEQTHSSHSNWVQGNAEDDSTKLTFRWSNLNKIECENR